MSDQPETTFLNIFEIETEDGPKHFVGFIDPEEAEAEGIDPRCLVGEFEPLEDGEFDVHTFRVNPDFLAAFVEYMNGDPSRADDVIAYARTIPGEPLHIVDPRNHAEPDAEPPTQDVLGAFQVDDAGRVIPDSFQYHQEYQWFSLESGTSELLQDPRFYEWMHSSGA